MELALGNFVVVVVVSVLLSFIDLHDHVQDGLSEVFGLDGLGGEGEGVAKHGLWVGGALDGGPDDVDALGLERDADRLLVLALHVALLKLAIDDGLHARVNLNLLLTLSDRHLLRRVRVDALVNQSLHVLALLRNIELVSCLKSETQCVFILLEVVENFGAYGGSEVSLGEGLFVGEGLNFGERVGDLVPLVVDDAVELLQGVHLLAHLAPA
mmetsp:Transcript_46933/g.62116  ORF Transcript_46933/g.62116 Transcript_46933/m.62116 type:complete len:212 (-) Transcript_46933:150-785(-)